MKRFFAYLLIFILIFAIGLYLYSSYIPYVYKGKYQKMYTYEKSSPLFKTNEFYYLTSLDSVLRYIKLPIKWTNFYYFTDLDTAISYSKIQKKDILIVFTCWACMSNPGTEWRTLSNYNFNSLFYSKYNIVLLYVDDQKKMKEKPFYDPLFLKKEIRTIGDRNMMLQIKLAEENVQPSFVIVNTKMNRLGKPMSGFCQKEGVEAFFENAH